MSSNDPQLKKESSCSSNPISLFMGFPDHSALCIVCFLWCTSWSLTQDRTSLFLHCLTPPPCLCPVLIIGSARKLVVQSGRWILENAPSRVCRGISRAPCPQGAIISQFRLIDLPHPGGHCLTWGLYLHLIEPSIPRRVGTTSCPMLNKEQR